MENLACAESDRQAARVNRAAIDAAYAALPPDAYGTIAEGEMERVLERAFAAISPTPGAETFQDRVDPWLIACFGEGIARDGIERNHRFLEEALELVQSTGCTQSEAHQLVDYVYGRPVGDPVQEVGGVMNTLAALCLAHGMDMHECGEVELARVWTKVEKIRAKQAAKPKHSPLPEAVPVPRPPAETDAAAIRAAGPLGMYGDYTPVSVGAGTRIPQPTPEPQGWRPPKPIDEIDVSGWGVWKCHAIPMEVCRHIAAKANERFGAAPMTGEGE